MITRCNDLMSLQPWKMACLSSLQERSHATGLLVLSPGEQAEQAADDWAGPSHPQSTYLQGIPSFVSAHTHTHTLTQLQSGSEIMNIYTLSLSVQGSQQESRGFLIHLARPVGILQHRGPFCCTFFTPKPLHSQHQGTDRAGKSQTFRIFQQVP